MKNIAILVDGKIKFVANWPLTSNRICQRHIDEGITCQEVCYFSGGALKTCEDKQIQQALANAIEFKDQEQARILICESTGYKGEGVISRSWNHLNPTRYSVNLKLN